MKKIYETVTDFLSNQESVVLARLIASSGSTPREAGAMMVVRQNGSIAGTIGGGRIEAEVILLAREIFSKKTSVIKNYNLTADGIASIGMICGGDASVFVQYLDASDGEFLEFYRKVLETGKKKVWLVTEAFADGTYRQYLLEKANRPEDPQAAAIHDRIKAHLGSKNLVIQDGGVKYILEFLEAPDRAYVFGGGHVGQALVPVLKHVGFQITVIDDRAEFSDKERFPAADQTLTANVPDAFRQLEIDAQCYIIIVTRGHMNDYDVLKLALKTEACYIGMIGSKKKWAALQEKMLAEGMTQKDIDRVHAPVGLRIMAETPEEIAVSIAGEMILVRAGLNQARIS